MRRRTCHDKGENVGSDGRIWMGYWLLVLTGFGFGAAYGLLVRGSVQWGTVGEWIGGAGAFFAGAVALHLERNNGARVRQRERELSAISVARIVPRLLSVADWLENVVSEVHRDEPDQRLKTFLLFANSRLVLDALDRLIDMRTEIPNVPARQAIALEGLFTSSTSVKELVAFIASTPKRDHSPLLHHALVLCAMVSSQARVSAEQLQEAAGHV